MRLQFLESGEIVSTHGVRGEMKVLPWADGPEFLVEFNRVYIDGVEYKVESCRIQKNCNLLKLSGVDTIEQAQAMRGKTVQIFREDADPDLIFAAELVGVTVMAENQNIGVVVDVLDYGDILQKNGLSLLNGPGNDLVAVTNLVAAGAHIVLFTTGRGTPAGGPAPTVKIATNHSLAERKRNWIDFDASPLLEGVTMNELTDQFLAYILRVASGEETANERNGCCEISIFKDGITL